MEAKEGGVRSPDLSLIYRGLHPESQTPRCPRLKSGPWHKLAAAENAPVFCSWASEQVLRPLETALLGSAVGLLELFQPRVR